MSPAVSVASIAVSALFTTSKLAALFVLLPNSWHSNRITNLPGIVRWYRGEPATAAQGTAALRKFGSANDCCGSRAVIDATAPSPAPSRDGSGSSPSPSALTDRLDQRRRGRLRRAGAKDHCTAVLSTHSRVELRARH